MAGTSLSSGCRVRGLPELETTVTWGCTRGSNVVGRHQCTTTKSPEEWVELDTHLSGEEELRGIAGELGSGRQPEVCSARLQLSYVPVEVG